MVVGYIYERFPGVGGSFSVKRIMLYSFLSYFILEASSFSFFSEGLLEIQIPLFFFSLFLPKSLTKETQIGPACVAQRLNIDLEPGGHSSVPGQGTCLCCGLDPR